MTSILTDIDAFLDRMTMYRLTLYVLTAFILAGLLEALLGALPYAPLAILYSAGISIGVCWIVNSTAARLFGAATSVESVYITAFILVLIMPPVSFGNVHAALILAAASALAMGSKYLLAPQKKHFLNPAAFGAASVAILFGGYASWWIGGNVVLEPVVLIGGLAIVRKLRRADLVLTFLAVAVVAIVATTPSTNYVTTVLLAVQHTPLLFFAFIMLTEPLTTPPTRSLRLAYAALTGILFAPAFHVGSVYSSPELALLVANIFSYLVSPKGRSVLTLVAVEETSASTKDFIFQPDRAFSYTPGQFMEWTLPHEKPDARGTRRFFTLASSPTESTIRLGVKFYPKPSTFKQALSKLRPGSRIFATQLGGEFTLPKDIHQKLAFIAGGIGVTPFRSHLQSLLDNGEKRDIVVLYANKASADIAYAPLLQEAEKKIHTKVVNVVAEQAEQGMRTGMINAPLIKEEVPDYRERFFYISGPQAMVATLKSTLLQMGVRRSAIRTDYFVGLA